VGVIRTFVKNEVLWVGRGVGDCQGFAEREIVVVRRCWY
jgi:hypothetical protein